MTTDTLRLAMQLMTCPSVTPNDADCQKIIADRLIQAGFEYEFLQFDEVTNLFARYGTASPFVLFAGHTDVVPTGPVSDWMSPPFQPTIRTDHLYGRGACDMKTAIASMIVAVEKFIHEHPNFQGSLGFLITSDEEGPAVNGTKRVMQTLIERNIKIDCCIVGEPSSDKQVGDQIRVGRRGSLHGKLAVHGKQGHVAHPHLALNPIHSSMHALHELAHTEWDKGNESFPPTTFQITNIHSGTGAANVIPGHLEALFNFRFSTAITIDELKNRTQEIFDRRKLTSDIEWRLGGEPFLTERGKLIQATKEAIKEVTGLTTKLSTGGGTSDGRFIAPTGAEVVELGVPHTTAHQIDECVNIQDLETLTLIYHRLLTLLLTS